MADYRNLAISFLVGSVNVTKPVDQLGPGELSRGLNLRPTTEGIIEARPTQGLMRYGQKALNGFENPYPSQWSTGPVESVKYIGDITADSETHDGYLISHTDTPVPTGTTDSGYRTFVNGAPVLKRTAYSTYDILELDEYNVVRCQAPNGLPMVIMDGQWWFLLNQCNFDSPDDTIDTLAAGYTTLNGVPLVHAYRLGIPQHPVAATVTTTGTGLTGDYYYRVSGYNTDSGMQGPPSPVSSMITLSNNGGYVTWTDTNTYGNFTHWRVWRLGGGVGDWRLVGDIASTNSGSSINYTDTAPDADVVFNELLDTDSVEIFSSINTSGATATAQKFKKCFGPFIGKYMFWVGDPVRKNHVYWNTLLDPGRHDPSADVNAVSDPAEELLNGFIFGNAPYVFSDRRLYALDFSPTLTPAFQPREVPIGIGAAGKNAFAVAPHAVFLCSKDGIYITDCQPGLPLNISDEFLKPIFRGEARGSIDAVDYTYPDFIRLTATNKELHFLYRGATTGLRQHLVYDVEKRRWLQWTTDRTQSLYFDEGATWNRLLIGRYESQNTYFFDDIYKNVEETFYANFRSGATDLGAPLTYKEFGTLLLDYDPDGINIAFTPYYNSEADAGALQWSKTTNDYDGRRVQAFPLEDYYARNMSLDLAWYDSAEAHPKFYQAVLLYREDEEEVTEWEHPPQSLGKGGQYHIKDTYWGIRSNAPVTVKVWVDGHLDIYQDALANTSGERLKLYLELAPRLGTTWGFKLESSQPFRLYGEDCVLFAKDWQRKSGYEPMNPFSQAGYAAYLRKGGGT